MNLNRNTRIDCTEPTAPVQWAVEVLYRDLKTVCRPTRKPGGVICLQQHDCPPESWELVAEKEKLILRAGDNRGYIYGLLAISRRLLGVTDFWFWNDQQFSPVEEIPVPADFFLGSRPAAVKWRGWFVNDEVLLHRWQLDGSREKPWEMVFEALLRCGGNMVIPGTGENALRYRGLAQRMGLAVTHHHAEPLGARMFGEAYPDLEPRYDQYPAEFEALWAEALEEQGNDVVWNLGFRGQGDRPFWADDPRYDTQRSRGQLISGVIRRQYEMVQQRYPGAACATNLYGEIMELYRAGCLQLPAGVIKIWADNGYGAMVSRRQGNHDPRVPALPAPEDEGPHGIYYHASFYDLQGANHITMLPTSLSFVERELERVRHSGANDYWIINCSNVKPHVFTLAYIARIWQEGTVPAETFLTDYTCLYYGAQAQQAAGYFRRYYASAIHFGPHEDNVAGDQFANYPARLLVSRYMRGGAEPEHELDWAAPFATLEEQARWYRDLCGQAVQRYGEPEPAASPLLADSVLLQMEIYRRCYAGAVLAAQAVLDGLHGEYKAAFLKAGDAREEYLAADAAMRSREHDHWKGFYRNECLTDVKHTAWLLRTLMGYLRNQGDGPYFYTWQRDVLYTPAQARVMLITNMENHMEDLELYRALRKQKNQ